MTTLGTSTAIPRVAFASLTRQEFTSRFRRPGRPVVLEGALDGLPDWTLDYIEARLDPAPRVVRRYGAERFRRPRHEWRDYSTLGQLSISEYARMIEDRSAHRERVYMAQVGIGETPLGAAIRPYVEALGARCDMQRFAPCDLNLWLGPAGHTEPLHFDPAEGTLIQTHGAKRVVLFSPADTDGLYPFPIRGGGVPPWFSQVDIQAPDMERFPRLRKALGGRLEGIVEPGDALFIPAFWWHEVTALGDDFVCSVNRFWRIKPVWRNVALRGSGRMPLLSTMLFLSNHLPTRIVVALNRLLTARAAR